MEDGFLSIKEFAKLAGVTPQAIYKQLNNHSTKVDNQLNNHSTKVDNQKEDVLAILEEQLHIKDKQIETLQSDLAETRSQLSKIADQAQQLQLAQMKLLPNKEEQMQEREKKQKPNYWKGVSIGLMAIVAAGAVVFVLLLNGLL